MLRPRLIMLIVAVAGATFSGMTLAQDCGASDLKSQLLRRGATDQSARAALAADPESDTANARVLQVDSDNTAYMRGLVARCGWPKRSGVGERAAKAAWLLTQHADMDPGYQVTAAQRMKYAVLGGEANAIDLAVLVDRNRRLTNLPQVYGMQFFVTESGVVQFHDIVNPGLLDVRRKEIGLVPFYCHALEISTQLGGASIRWPNGVLLSPQHCADAP